MVDRIMISLTRLQTFYGTLEGNALLRVMMREEFAGKIALVSSFGADAAWLIHLVAEINPATPILFLETGKHFPETLAYIDTLKKRYGLTDIRFLTPDPAMLSRIDGDGTLWQKQPNRCCWLRKVEPLQRVLKTETFEAVITGRKMYQTSERETLETIELYEDGVFRINPFARMTHDAIKEAYRALQLPEHPLLKDGYLSIGCAPCTRKVNPGEDIRAGRWAHTRDNTGNQKTECGIHIQENADWSV